MAYERTEWQKGMVLTAENLNKIENALAGISSVVNVDTDSTTGVVTTETTTSSLSVSGTSNLNGAANIKGATTIGTTDAGGSANLTVNGNITGTGAISGDSASINDLLVSNKLQLINSLLVQTDDIYLTNEIGPYSIVCGQNNISYGRCSLVCGENLINYNDTAILFGKYNSTLLQEWRPNKNYQVGDIVLDENLVFECIMNQPQGTLQMGPSHGDAATTYWIKTSGKYVELIGNGADDSHRSNARTLDWEGNEVLAGGLTADNLIINTEAQMHGTIYFGTESIVDNQTIYSGTATFNTETNILHGSTTIDNLIVSGNSTVSGTGLFGSELTTTPNNKLVIGQNNTANSNGLFIIGNGTTENHKSALCVDMQGNIMNNNSNYLFYANSNNNVLLHSDTNVSGNERSYSFTFTKVTGQGPTAYYAQLQELSNAQVSQVYAIIQNYPYIVIDDQIYHISSSNITRQQQDQTLTVSDLIVRIEIDNFDQSQFTASEFYKCVISGNNNIITDSNSTILGNNNISTGFNHTIRGNFSHIEGYNNKIVADYAHAEGYGTIAASDYQHVEGKYNIADTEGQFLHIVGNGTAATRSNAYTLSTTGDGMFAGNLDIGNNLKIGNTTLTENDLQSLLALINNA